MRGRNRVISRLVEGTVFGYPADEVAAVWQIVAGVGTLAAVIVAMSVAIADARRRDADRRDGEAAQARTVTATLAFRQGDGRISFPGWKVVIANHSGAPITQVVLEGAEAVTREPRHVSRWKFTTSKIDDQTPVLLCDVLGAFSEHLTETIKFLDNPSPPGYYLDADKPKQITFTFLDANGRRWRRVNNGRPQPVLDPANP